MSEGSTVLLAGYETVGPVTTRLINFYYRFHAKVVFWRSLELQQKAPETPTHMLAPGDKVSVESKTQRPTLQAVLRASKRRLPVERKRHRRESQMHQ